MIDEQTRGILEGLIGALTKCRDTLLMYAPHLPANTPVLRGSAFWIEEAQKLAAQGTEAQRATTTQIGVVHNGPVRDSECAQTPGGGGK